MQTFQLAQFHETEIHKFSAEASDLGLKPGEWPTKFEVSGMGNGQPFYVVTIDDYGRKYKQGNGCIYVTIFND